MKNALERNAQSLFDLNVNITDVDGKLNEEARVS